MLIKNELIECIGTTSPKSYKTTPKGTEMMNRLGSIQKELQELTV
jgi:predicted transcriptional regulator